MPGSCPKNLKSLKGGVTCYDNAGQTCFCSKVGCKCNKRFGPGRDYDAHLDWCAQYDPQGAHNKWCKDQRVSTKVGPLQQVLLPASDPDNPDRKAYCDKKCGFLDALCEGAKTQAGCGGSSDDMMYLALAGLGVLALIVLIR